jgi:nucleoside-diphosphate-sugar epimerase
MALSYAIESYHLYSRGQLPAILTPYRSASTWRRLRFDNARLRTLGWRPLLSLEEGLQQTFEGLRLRLEAGETLV